MLTRAALALTTLVLLAACGQAGPAAPRTSARAIGCLPGQCGGSGGGGLAPKPLPCRTVAVKAIGCLPGQCATPKPCR